MTHLLLNTIIAILLGTAIGLKTEEEKSRKVTKNILGGFRTHALLALLGVISAIFYSSNNLLISGLITGTVLLLVILYYASGAFQNEAYGITDEISAIFTHLIGLLLILQPISTKYIIAFVVVIVFITTRKKMIRKVRTHITEKEVIQYSLFAIIALVILPFLPNESISLDKIEALKPILNSLSFYKSQTVWALDIINPFKIWFIVVFISGLDLIAHIMSKFISQKDSLFLSAAIGGFITSTSTTVTLAIRSKTKEAKNNIDELVAATLAANASSFIQILILVAPISYLFFKKIFIPTMILAIGGYILALIIRSKNKKKSIIYNNLSNEKEDKEIFRIEPAIKLALLLTVIKLISKIALIYIGPSGFIISSMFAAMVGMDAIIINIAELTNILSITLELAFFTYMAANFVNIVSKIIYAHISGDKEFAKKFTFYISILFIISFIVGIII